MPPRNRDVGRTRLADALAANGALAASDTDNARDDLLLRAVLAGATYGQAAELSNYSTRTIERRMADPAFKRRVLEGRAQMQSRNLQLLQAATPAGLQALTIAASGFEEVRITNPVTGEVESHQVRVPWTARIQAAAKLVELGVGSLARIQVEVDVSPDRSEVEDSLTARLAAYAAIPAPETPASEQVVDAASVESEPATAQPAPVRRRRG